MMVASVKWIPLVVLLVVILPGGFFDIGHPCNRVIKICLASNAYCDEKNICRCRPKYPVVVAPHSCRRGKNYGEKCEYSEECLYHDPNSYCTQLPYRSTCECHTDFKYNELSGLCERINMDSPKPSNRILPTALGACLAIAGLLCCLMIIWHFFKRSTICSACQHSLSSHSNVSPRPCTILSLPSNVQNTGVSTEEALPNYDMATASKETNEECGPPPSYEEVVRSDYVSQV